MSVSWDSSTLNLAADMLGLAAYQVQRDESGRLSIAWESGCERLLGHTARELGEEPALQALFGKDHKDWLCRIGGALDSGTGHDWEHEVYGAQGNIRIRHRIGGIAGEKALGLITTAASQELPESVQLQLDILEHLPVGVYFIDSEYRVQWTNHLGTRQSHINWKKHYGEICYQLPFGREEKCDNCPVVRSLEHGEMKTNELAMPHGDTWLMSAMPTYDRSGKCIGAVEVVTDISEIASERNSVLARLQMREAQLRRQNKALMSLHRNVFAKTMQTEDSIHAVTETGAKLLDAAIVRIWLHVKDGFVCLDEYNGEADVHHSKSCISEFMHSVFEESLILRRQVYIEDMETVDVPPNISREYDQVNTRSLLYCPIRMSGEVAGAIVFADTKPRRWTLEEQTFGSTLADFTALVISHVQLLESQRSMRTLLSNLPGMAFRLHYEEGRLAFDFISEGCLEVTGYTQAEFKELLEKDPFFHVYPDDIGLVDSMHQAVGRTGKPEEFMYRIFRKDGSIRWVWERNCMVKVSGEKNNVFFEGFLHDTTERFKLQEAELDSKSKSEFMSTMSHEIRTPLNAILGMSHQALKTGLNGKQRGYLDKINSAAHYLLGIINDILVFSKIDAGMVDLEQTSFAIKELVATQEALFREKARKRGLELDFTIDDDVPELLCGDFLRISQVLGNLVGNSLKFTESGGIYVRCAVAGREGDSVDLRFTIRDTGIGMAASQLEKVFESFYQADASITRKYGGTGLGLSISKKLATLMDGDVLVKSEEGRGTTMTFLCRVGLCEQPVPDPVTPKQEPPHFLGQKILLVEDNVVNQEIAVELLSELNLQVVVADDGKKALSLLKRETDGASRSSGFSLIFMDLQMPVLDGYQTTRRIRSDPAYNDVPIIAMTAHAMDSERERCLNAGMNEHITKPVDIQALYNLLRRYLKEE